MKASQRQHWMRALAFIFSLGTAFAAPMTVGQDEPVVSGRLRPFGHYLSSVKGQITSVLPDGSVLTYGSGPWIHGPGNEAAQTLALRERSQRAYPSAPDTAPKLWDHARKGWRRLPPPPECPHPARAMHTATVLNDGKVLLAGGLCDEPKMGDDTSPQKAYTALSLLDPATRHWLPVASLSEARIFHAATLMRDGSVMITGGAVDPGLTDTPHALVLASAEQFAAGRVTPQSGMAQARAKHTATLLADGSLFVAGGFDDAGRALASAERWDPATHAWTLLPPPHVARYGHTATLLQDGRVMVSGGIGGQGQILSSVELWDPRTREWVDAAPLPIPLYGHAATLLASGKVLMAGGTWISQWGPIPWAWTWSPLSNTWQVAGHVNAGGEQDLASTSTQITLAPRPDGGALVFTPQHVMHWEPSVETDPRRLAPLWRERPSATLMADGRIMWVGVLESDMEDEPYTAHIWDPRTGLWAEAGPLSQRGWMHASLRQLPSGLIIHVGGGPDSGMICEAWAPSSGQWQGCGGAPMKQASRPRVRLGTLPDGRAFAIATDEDAFVFDEASRTWVAWQLQWQTEGLTYGAPIRGAHALLTIRHPGTGERFAINDEAARNWQESSETPISMLWDGPRQQWAYLFLGRRMGADAQWLPDGCALSMRPLAVFNRDTGLISPLIDPGMGIEPGSAETVILPDGTVVAAGPSAGAKDAGAGFFVGKASCAGFAPNAGLEGYVSGDVVSEVPAPALASSAPGSSAVQAMSASVRSHAWLEWMTSAMPGRASVLIAALVLLVGYALIKTTGTFRLLIGGAALVTGLSAWWVHKRMPGAHDAASCRMVGVWSARHEHQMRRVELRADGSYVMGLSEAGGNDPVGGYRGRWAVHAGNMIWHDQTHGLDGEPDVNRILPDSDTRFTLVEADGSHTVFELIRPLPSETCKP